MKTSAYQKRQAAASKRAKKTRARRIKQATTIHGARQRRIRQRSRHKCEEHDRPMMSAVGMRYEMASRVTATCHGGIGLAHAVARQSGLVHALNENVQLLQNHFPYHESDHVLNIAFNPMTDGTCLEDLKKETWIQKSRAASRTCGRVRLSADRVRTIVSHDRGSQAG